MKQVIQSYRTGQLEVMEAPAPLLRKGRVLVQTAYSLISAGTERAKLDIAKKSLLAKARSRPDLVKKVLQKARQDGPWRTWLSVWQRLNTPVSLGYSSAGVILEVAEDVVGLKRGDQVACAGEYANHAETIAVPQNLVARVPESVGLDRAAFAAVGAIALQGVRQAGLQIGERVAVIGLGLIGLLTVQILKASGCQTIGLDVAPNHLMLGKQLGCLEVISIDDRDLLDKVQAFTGGHGVDATIIAAATRSSRPIEQAGAITREKGRVVVVGAVGMNMSRDAYYRKELDLRFSRSYGPGRYDPKYEEKGLDYPFAYVRFTARRNMQCFLELIRNQQVELHAIITHRFPIAQAAQAYALVQARPRVYHLGVLLEYRHEASRSPTRIDLKPKPNSHPIVVGVIGAGNYATAHLLPYLQQNAGVTLGTLCTATGTTALHIAKEFGFRSVDSDCGKIISGSDAIVIATRHQDHASYAMRALQQGKSVFVEKPLVMNLEELEKITAIATHSCHGSIMAGFNRRFSPAIEMVKAHFASRRGPKQVLIRVNAGPLPHDHWIHDPEAGGGRLLGEACHFIDLIVALTEATIETVGALAIPRPDRLPALWEDFSITLRMSEGSVGTLVYTSKGDTGLSKEHIEVFSEGKIGVINDFKSIELWSGGRKVKRKWLVQDKGQKNQVEAWIRGLQSGESPMPFHEIANVHQACLAAVRALRQGDTIRL
ncbi:MAG: bi-domain-containing oxidoreductase [bacterium]